MAVKASHGIIAARRESLIDWEVEEAESLEVRPEYLITGNFWEGLGSVLVFSLSFKEVGFLGKGGRPA